MWKILALGAAVSVMASAVSAEPRCGARKTLVKQLERKYQETSIAIGVGNDGKLVEVLSNGDGGTWTIIATSPAGISCLVAAGRKWRSIDRTALDPGI